MKPASPHLLFLPGLACDATVWQHQAAHFSKITTVQVAEYGASDSLEKMARVAVRSAPEKFAVAAHSMGGRVAFEIYRSAPDRVMALALLDTAYRPRLAGEAGERERSERLALVALAETHGMRAMARQWVQKMVHPGRLADKELIDSIIEMFGRKSPEIFRAQITALLNRPDAAPVLATIRCPALVLCGREDSWSPVAQHEGIAARIRGSKLAIVERCGHMSPMERPADVTTALDEWFEKVKQ